MIRIGIIGYGNRAGQLLKGLGQLSVGAAVAAVTDVRNDEIARQMLERGEDPASVTFYTDPDKMLDVAKLDGVIVATRCSLHTRMAVKVMERGLPLFLEKPVATNMQDLMTLRDAAKTTTSEVVVSFPLRTTPLGRLAKEIVDSGKIGTVEHVQAWNNVFYGNVYYFGWYRDENETQGLFMQKATHDFDYINYVLEIKARRICAMTSKQIFKGDRPAGKRCDDCDEWDTCLESPYHRFYSKQEKPQVQLSGLMCGFAVDTGNEDSGSAIIEYETGMHVCYSQNFFTRRKAGGRGAKLFGYKGTIDFDWYKDEINVHMHHVPRTETYKTEAVGLKHLGGDTVLLDNFVRVMRSEQGSISPLSAGIQSVLMCLKAKESAATHTFQDIAFPE